MFSIHPSGSGDRIGGALAAPARWVHTRDVLRELIARDIKLRYRGSLLGIVWTLLNPLAELLVLMFVFGTVLDIQIPNYAVYLFTGLIVYGWFQTSVSFATMAVVGSRELVRRPGVSPAILPVVTVAANLVHFLLSLPVLIALLLLSGLPITAAVLALPALIAIEFVLILGVAYPVAAINVWFRDTQHVLRIALQLLFYLTPVFYDTTSVPAGLQWFYRINPLAHLVDAFRTVLLDGAIPAPSSLAYLMTVSGLLLLVGYLSFHRISYRFADEL